MNCAKEKNNQIVGVDEFPELPGIDRDKAHAQFMGKISLYRRIMGSFRKNYQGFEQSFRDVMYQRDMSASSRLAHSLKGVAANIAAIGLYSATTKLEEACNSGSKDLDIYLDTVATELDHLMAGLDQSEFMAYSDTQALPEIPVTKEKYAEN